MLQSPTVQSPLTLQETYAALAAQAGELRIIAGGTDLMVLLNADLLDDRAFLDIHRVDELRGISDEGDCLRVGALTTYTQLIQAPLIRRFVPALTEASRTIGAIQIQNRGTLGGNIVNASPAGDSLPVLAAYDAEILIGSLRGTRSVPFNQFYTGYRRTVLAPDELVIAARLPKLRAGERDFFYKVGTRRAQAISKTVMAAKVKPVASTLEAVSIGVGSVAPTIIRAWQTERLLAGASLTRELIEQARQLIASEVKPISDLRSTEHYRRTVTGNVLAKFLRQLMESAARQSA